MEEIKRALKNYKVVLNVIEMDNQILTSERLKHLKRELNEAINYIQCCKSEAELFCECGGNERIALDCTIKPCKHPKYRNK